jgi:hypothetical protein
MVGYFGCSISNAAYIKMFYCYCNGCLEVTTNLILKVAVGLRLDSFFIENPSALLVVLQGFFKNKKNTKLKLWFYG